MAGGLLQREQLLQNLLVLAMTLPARSENAGQNHNLGEFCFKAFSTNAMVLSTRSATTPSFSIQAARKPPMRHSEHLKHESDLDKRTYSAAPPAGDC
eukprot:m.35482 g.35482  ORF g.35482 m.35482 type:complete len:97 (-) comp44113_c0_seq1:60-350(-)